MELREFAERVLFATKLEDKLWRPEVITDEHPGPALAAPLQPGRPEELQFKPPGVRNRDFPSLQELEQERERGRLLHFFANHELLATELMALVLLRFPEAPPAFRRGVLQTLQEEQDHTRMYVRRMAQCGLTFGELPVSGYFWRAVSPMEHPIDFVAGLSLTFEQANLDFCRQFAAAFRSVGDGTTGELLDGIYRDEIAHVAHGLKWFRRWKDPGSTDWDAFQRQLRFPLSPQRAKGTVLNVEGRRAAGLDPAFIAELDVFSQSKGRTPHVHVFNPFTEGHLARGKTFVPVRAQLQLARDLANLPQFLARQDDIVLVPRRPAATFLSGLKRAGFPLPEFVELDPKPAVALRALADRKLGALKPWAWGPDSRELLRPLFGSLTGMPEGGDPSPRSDLVRLFSKEASAGFLREVLRAEGEGAQRWLCPEEVVGVTVRTLEEALEEIRRQRTAGFVRLVAKESLGVAGCNAVRLWEPALLESQERWLASTLQQGIPVVIEPWLERTVDFSTQWEMRPGGLRFLGFTGLLNDHRGQYQGNWVEPHPGRVSPAVSRHFPPVRSRELAPFFQRLGERLEPWLRSQDFQGPLGVDAFVYRTADGEFRLKPVVEINPRYTMGRVALELMRYVHSGSQGRFRLIHRGQLRREGYPDFPSFAEAITGANPIRWAGHPTPRIQEGTLCLNDPQTVEAVLAVFEVSR